MEEAIGDGGVSEPFEAQALEHGKRLVELVLGQGAIDRYVVEGLLDELHELLLFLGVHIFALTRLTRFLRLVGVYLTNKGTYHLFGLLCSH